MPRSNLIIALALSLLTARQTLADAPKPAHSAHQGGATQSPHQALDKLDTRKPAPLNPMMALHQKQNMHVEEHFTLERCIALALENIPRSRACGGRASTAVTMPAWKRAVVASSASQ